MCVTEKKFSIAVVIPMYEAHETIFRAIKSIVQQTKKVDHIILIDDGSSKPYDDILHNIVTDLKITYIRQENKGPSIARNRGIDISNEDIVCFLDADDVWRPDKIEKQYDLYLNLKQRNIYVGMIDCFEKVHYNDNTTQIFKEVKRGQHFDDFIKNNIINGTSCVFADRTALINIGGFDSEIRFAEDRWLWTQVAENYEIHTVPELLSDRYVGSNNITSNPSKYFNYKLMFINKYIYKYRDKLSRYDRIQFYNWNLYDFQRAFFEERNYKKVIDIYILMYKNSKRSIFFNRFKSSGMFLIAFIKENI